jgi:hypothetical protein
VLDRERDGRVKQRCGQLPGEGKTVGVKSVGVRFGSAPGKNDGVRTASRWGGVW